jgi:hypothetical protein
LLYNIGEWKVSKANAKKFLEFMGRFVEWQKENRKKFYYTRSTFGILKTEDTAVETWMYIDEYKDQESYDKFGEDFRRSNPDWAGFFRLRDEFESLIVPNSYNCEVLIEKPELRIA